MSHARSRLLLVHDGELPDVRELLEAMQVDFVEHRGAPTSRELDAPWRVLVGTPRRVLELQVGAVGEKPVRIAMIDGDSRTLLAMLRRSGVDLMVQRPVHPSALRLIVLHALYRGPEKRRHERITIGAPVQFRAGLRRHEALLADLSLRGCRLLSTRRVASRSRIKVHFGSALGADRGFAVKGRVVRSGPTEGAGAGMQAIAVCFDEVSRERVRDLKSILRAHVSGPHTFRGAATHVTRPLPAPMDAGVRARERTAPPTAAPYDAAAPPPDAAEAPGPLPSGPSGAVPPAGADRRGAPRHVLDRHLIALGIEATRVLMGRDIGVGGMRIDRNDTLECGERLRIAVHVRARSEPLVIDARVERDDGDDGMVLRFEDLGEAAEQYLRKMVAFLPILAARGGDEGTGVIVSEVLERGGERAAASHGPACAAGSHPAEARPAAPAQEPQ